jgi:fructokinase
MQHSAIEPLRGVSLSATTATPAPATVACVGEALIDLVTEPDGRLRACLGGAVFNLARALGRQGVATRYVNPLSSDRFGRALAAALADDGVQLGMPQLVAQPSAHPTALAIATLDAQGKAAYSFYREGVADRAVTAESLITATADVPVVVTGCLALAPADQAAVLPWLAHARARGATVVIDCNMRPAAMPDLTAYRQNVLAALQYANLVKASDDDLIALGISDTEAWFSGLPAQLLLLTLGERGAVAYSRGAAPLAVRDPLPVVIADTIGAGDCFLAGFLAAWLGLGQPQQRPQSSPTFPENAHLEGILRHAVASASLCVEQAGCVPPTRQQVLTRLASG